MNRPDDEQEKANLAANINAYLERLGWDQRRLARESGESEMTISRICRGKSMPLASALKRLANALGVSMDWLMSHHRAAARKKERIAS